MTRLINIEDAALLKTVADGGLSAKALWRRINAQPTIDAEPVRHGKWIYSNDFHWYVASCNKCGYQRKTDIKAEGWNQWKFCPNCGAKMQTGGDRCGGR